MIGNSRSRMMNRLLKGTRTDSSIQSRIGQGSVLMLPKSLGTGGHWFVSVTVSRELNDFVELDHFVPKRGEREGQERARGGARLPLTK